MSEGKTKIKLKMMVPDKDGNYQEKLITITDNGLKIKREKVSMYTSREDFVYHQSYTYIMPRYVHKCLHGEIVKVNGLMGRDMDFSDLSKSVTRGSIPEITTYLTELFQYFVYHNKRINSPEKEKVIFIKYTCVINEDKTANNKAKMGKDVSIDFQYFVGYKIGKSSFDVDMRQIGSSFIKEDLSTYSVTKWTEEKEKRVEEIYQRFIGLGLSIGDLFSESEINKLLNGESEVLKLS